MDYNISDKMKDMKPSAIREIFKSLTDPRIIPFAAGNPAPESFPAEDFRDICSDILTKTPVKALQYGITEGYPELREDVTDRLSKKFSIGRDFDTTIITSGGQQGLELACKVMCNEGDTVICEEPTFIGALNAFRSLGCKTAGVPLEDDGINIEKLEETLKKEKRAKLLYLIPSFQNPAGLTTSLKKRVEIYDLARKYNVIILEDNPYGELRFDGDDIPTIKSFDTEGRVIYCGSFSKILSAGIRVGFVSAPGEIAQKMVVAKQVEDVHTNMLVQMMCSQFIRTRDLDAHVKFIRGLYKKKAGLMLSALDAEMPEAVKYTRPQGGLFLYCTLPDKVDITDLTAKLLKRFVAVVPGSAFSCDPAAPTHSIRLNYSTPSDEGITKGIHILCDTIKEII